MKAKAWKGEAVYPNREMVAVPLMGYPARYPDWPIMMEAKQIRYTPSYMVKQTSLDKCFCLLWLS